MIINKKNVAVDLDDFEKNLDAEILNILAERPKLSNSIKALINRFGDIYQAIDIMIKISESLTETSTELFERVIFTQPNQDDLMDRIVAKIDAFKEKEKLTEQEQYLLVFYLLIFGLYKKS